MPLRSGMRRVPAAVRWSVLAGGLLAIVLLLAPPLGTDLSAQAARADFFRRYGLTPVDLRWYGGTVPFGYSWTSPALMALVGPRITGALALLASAAALALLLVRTGARRPVLGGVLGAAAFAGNLVSGRVTFALGVACGLWALVALTAGRQWVRYAGAVAGALLAGATSPVAGLFAGLAATAWIVALLWRPGNHKEPRSLGPPIALGAAAAVPLALNALLFNDGGWMNLGRNDTIRAILAGVAVALLVRVPALRIGALLSSAGVLAAFVVETPVGLNATRLVTMFALPVVAAFAGLGWRWLGAALVVLALWQPPVVVRDLGDAGNPTAHRAYFAPLLVELERRAPVGRVAVPPTRDYWEAAYVAERVPLARGWLRQVDLERNPLFFDATLTAGEYERWLRDNGVTYVALPDAELSWVGRSERAVIDSRPPYLEEVWRGEHWTLWRVRDAPTVVEGATLVASTPTRITFDAASPGDVLVRVRWSRWLRVEGPPGARMSPAERWVTVWVARPGRYTITS